MKISFLPLIQSDTTQTLIEKYQIDDNFFWPVLVTIVGIILTTVWQLLLKNKVKSSIDYEKSYLLKYNEKFFVVLYLVVNNETEQRINKLEIETEPAFEIHNQLRELVTFDDPNKPSDTVKIGPMSFDKVQETLNAEGYLQIEPRSSLSGRVIIEVNDFSEKIKYLKLNYLAKTKKIRIKKSKLSVIEK